MFKFDIMKSFRYTKSGGMPKEKKRIYFDKKYLTIFKIHLAIPIKDNLRKSGWKNEEKKGE